MQVDGAQSGHHHSYLLGPGSGPALRLPAKETSHQHYSGRPHISPKVTALASASSLHSLKLSGEACLAMSNLICFQRFTRHELHQTRGIESLWADGLA